MNRIRDELMRLLVSGDARLIGVRVEGDSTVVHFDAWDTDVSEESVSATFQGDHSRALSAVLDGCVMALEHRVVGPAQATATEPARELWSMRLEVPIASGGTRPATVEIAGRLLRLDIVPKRVAILRVAVCPDECPLLAEEQSVAVLVQDLVGGERFWETEFLRNLGDPRKELSLDMVRCNFRGQATRLLEDQACRLAEEHPLRSSCPLVREAPGAAESDQQL